MPVLTDDGSCGSASGAPSLRWQRVLLLTLALIASLSGGLEAYWRAKGLRPTVPETLDLWSFWRQRVYATDGKVIVLAGTSRISSAVSLSTLCEGFPDYRVVQLGIPGAVSCIGLLKDLADDPAFRGLVICEVDAPFLQRSEWDGHRNFRTYKPRTLASQVDVVAKAWLQGRLIVLDDRRTLGLVAAAMLGQPVARRDKMHRTFFREVRWDFGTAGDEAQYREEIERARAELSRHGSREWKSLAEDAREINGMVQRLRDRGGDVVFLRAPSTRKRWLLEEESYPRTLNWDRFARLIKAPCIHFLDVPEMRSLTCPDGSHIDYRDSPQFTRALISRLNVLAMSRQLSLAPQSLSN
jgi:hypothetical protein